MEEKKYDIYDVALPAFSTGEIILSEYYKSESLKKILDSGDYILFDNRIVPYELGRYLIITEKRYSEFIFHYKFAPIWFCVGKIYDPKNSLFFRESDYTVKDTDINTFVLPQRINSLTNFISTTKAEINEIYNPFPWETLDDAITQLCKKNKITEKMLSELLGVTDHTLRNYKKGKSTKKNVEITIAICIIFHLYPNHSRYLLELNGLTLRNTEKDNVYKLILDFGYNMSLKEINDFLKAKNLKPLV